MSTCAAPRIVREFALGMPGGGRRRWLLRLRRLASFDTSPAHSAQAGNVIEVIVSRDHRQIMLPG